MASPAPVTVTARRLLKAEPQALFDTLVDERRLATVAGISRVRIVREGDATTKVGTRRRVQLIASAYLVEELVALDSPTRFDYRLVDAASPIDHRFGRIEFHRNGDVTEASWTSTYAVPTRVLGTLATQASRPLIHAAFYAALGALDAAALKQEAAR